MNPIAKFLYKAGDFLSRSRTKFFDYPNVTGGFEIFRNFTWEDGMSQTKQLGIYQKSLYVFASVSKIAQKTASIDWEMFRIKNKVGDTQEIFAHEALDLLYRPNPFQTKGEFFEKFMINKKLAGEAFILKVRNERGQVVELWNLRPDYITIVKDPKLFIKAYEFNKSDGKITFKPEDIIHDAYPNPLDEYGGVSALCAAQVRVETEQHSVNYQKNFFLNNARPDFILSSDNKIDANQKENIKSAWDARHKGSKNAGKGAFLEGGLKYQQVSISQREMDYIESLRMTRDDILTAFGVPKPIVAITDDVNLANANTAMEIFLSETIEPEIKRLTEKLNEHLIYPEYGEIFYIEYDKSFLPRNEKEEAEIHEIQLRSGTKLINEAREELGLPPIVGGNSLYMPISSIPVGGLPASKAPSKTLARAEAQKGHVFRGRSKALKFLEVREVVEAEIVAGLKKSARRMAKKEGSSALIPKEIRTSYADVVNKSIDKRGESFKPAILDFGEDQKKRVLSGLRDKSIDIKALDGAFDVAKENKLLAQISLPFIQEFVQEAGDQAMQTINPAEQFEITERVQKYIKERAKAMAKQVNDTTLEKLSRTLAEGLEAGEGIAKLTDRVNSVYEEYPTYRAEMIARTEATAANNRGFIESYDQSGVANAKEWIATNDANTRDSHASADGEIVGLEDSFSNGLEYPGDPSGDPSETVNCRCVLAPAFKE